MRKETDLVHCPIKNELIESYDCMIISDVVDGMIEERVLSVYGFSLSDEHRNMCSKCKWHDEGRV